MYLRQFADSNGKLAMVDRTDLSKRLPVTVNNACNQVGFYEIPEGELLRPPAAGHDPEVAEKALSNVEGAVAPLIQAVLNGSSLPEDHDADRVAIAVFAALQMTRTWSFRRELTEVAHVGAARAMREHATDGRLRQWLQQRGRPSEAEDIDAMRRRLFGPNGPKLKISDARLTQTAFELAIEVGLPELTDRAWHLQIFDHPALLTGDSPIAMPMTGSPGSQAPGLKTAKVLYWPLGRQHLLVFEQREAGGPSVRFTEHCPTERAVDANTAVASASERWIFHHPDDDPISGLILPSRPELVEETITVLSPDGEAGTASRFTRRHT